MGNRARAPAHRGPCLVQAVALSYLFVHGQTTMTEHQVPGRVRQLIGQLAAKDRSSLLALHAILTTADETGRASLHDVAIRYREDTLAAMRLEGRDTDREAGMLGIDEARANLAGAVLPRLASQGVIALARDPRNADGQPMVVIEPAF